MARRAPRAPRAFSLGSIVDIASQAFQELRDSPDGMPRRIWDELGPWMAGFTQTAAAKWLPYLANARPCKVPVLRSGVEFPCTNHAIGPCDACARPTCIHHGMVDQHGAIACYLCISETVRQKRGKFQAPPPPKDSDDRRPPIAPEVAAERVSRALATLGLKRGVAWEVIEKKRRKLLAESHPDKQRNTLDKEWAEKRYKEIGEAYMDLERFYKKSEAA